MPEPCRVLDDAQSRLRITTFFAGEHEVRVLDPARVELLAAIGCEVKCDAEQVVYRK
jgi:hypothetical protein